MEEALDVLVRIGSNDLTPSVKSLITQVVKAAHARGKKVGLCGQAPIERPEFAGFLASIGIDSISATPDALPTVVAHLVKFAGR